MDKWQVKNLLIFRDDLSCLFNEIYRDGFTGGIDEETG